MGDLVTFVLHTGTKAVARSPLRYLGFLVCSGCGWHKVPIALQSFPLA